MYQILIILYIKYSQFYNRFQRLWYLMCHYPDIWYRMRCFQGYSTENLEHVDVYLIFKWMHLHVWMHWWVNDYVHLYVLTSIGFRSIFKGDLKIKSDTWNWTDILFIQHISPVASLWPQRSLRWGSVVVKAIGTVIIISYTEHLISKLGPKVLFLNTSF